MTLTENEVSILGHTNPRRNPMLRSNDVTAMLRLHELGWGKKRIAREFGVSPNTVKKYICQNGWTSYQKPVREKTLDGLDDWLSKSFRQHAGNADVVRQDLKQFHGIETSLRTVERAVQPQRRELEAEAKATVRFETPPGYQLQIDFGSKTVEIGGEKTRVYFFVATLGFSRRNFVAAFRHERQSSWIEGLERAFQHFGGVPEEVLTDNPKTLVAYHDVKAQKVEFNERFLSFAKYWGFQPRACAPYRARTKGKDENGVGYVKKNAVAGHIFSSWEELDAHLSWWMREIADVRVHGTTGERPIDRFDRDESSVLRSLNGRPPFQQVRELHRKVHNDCCVEVDTNHYSAPWLLIGNEVLVQVVDGKVCIIYGGVEVACHPESFGRRQWIINKSHLKGIVGVHSDDRNKPPAIPSIGMSDVLPELLRPLSEYEALIGGGW